MNEQYFAASTYTCQQVALANSWRTALQSPGAFFGLVLLGALSKWTPRDGQLSYFRDAQVAAVDADPLAGYASAIDSTDPGANAYNPIHPRNKTVIGERLAAAALAVYYGMPIAWRNPSFNSSTAGAAAGADVSATVALADVATRLVETGEPCVYANADECTGFFVYGVGSNGVSFAANASAAVGTDGRSIVLTAAVRGVKAPFTVTGTSFGWGATPLYSIRSAEGAPLLPWFRDLEGAVPGAACDFSGGWRTEPAAPWSGAALVVTQAGAGAGASLDLVPNGTAGWTHGVGALTTARSGWMTLDTAPPLTFNFSASYPCRSAMHTSAVGLATSYYIK